VVTELNLGNPSVEGGQVPVASTDGGQWEGQRIDEEGV